MTIYKVKHGDYGSYEDGYSEYFDSMEKAVSYCKSKGFYRKEKHLDGFFTSPLSEKTMLKVGDFLLDVSDKWMYGELEYNDDDLWRLDCDFMSVREVTVH